MARSARQERRWFTGGREYTSPASSRAPASSKIRCLKVSFATAAIVSPLSSRINRWILGIGEWSSLECYNTGHEISHLDGRLPDERGRLAAGGFRAGAPGLPGGPTRRRR